MEPQSESDLRLPKPSLGKAIAALLLAGTVFIGLAFVMSDIGHATGCFIGACAFFLGAGYTALQR